MTSSGVQLKRDQSGMTLVEVLVFMFLTLALLGGLFKTASFAAHVDLSSEEKMATFFACKSVLEELHNTPFDDLTGPGSGFHGHHGEYERVTMDVPVHTRGGVKHTKLKATERVTLIEGTTGVSPHYLVTVTMEWNSNRGAKRTAVLTESVSSILYP